ncbi:hypothetical protein BDV25DRAFT_166527 [Aspergillus avenaceus]|uniref:Fungal N-terminal domain-containing protein n=1 Tax=Aspergillus avenaceus TaxID=36643 RepID=A0A5N6TE14_ASPAV|nr:hypothetical protein BDV25DRAFT_166527 [Aspergillus avenaceus]
MSGLEILGVVGNIIQLAELGAHLSIKLCNFYRKIKSADQSIRSLSNDIALTSNVLQQLGNALREDKEAKLCSAQAINTAQEVLEECKSVFQQIENTIEGPESERDTMKGRLQRATERFRVALMERDLDVLRSNLERLKSTMLLMLNVIMYAGQLQSRSESTLLQEQRDLVQTLIDEKRMNEQRFHDLSRALESAKSLPTVQFQVLNIPGPDTTADKLPDDLKQYYLLMKQILTEVENWKPVLEIYRYSRLRAAILNFHSVEASLVEQTHSPSTASILREGIYQLRTLAMVNLDAPPTNMPATMPLKTEQWYTDSVEDWEMRTPKRRGYKGASAVRGASGELDYLEFPAPPKTYESQLRGLEGSLMKSTSEDTPFASLELSEVAREEPTCMEMPAVRGETGIDTPSDIDIKRNREKRKKRKLPSRYAEDHQATSLPIGDIKRVDELIQQWTTLDENDISLVSC